jgi:hypothetical protein
MEQIYRLFPIYQLKENYLGKIYDGGKNYTGVLFVNVLISQSHKAAKFFCIKARNRRLLSKIRVEKDFSPNKFLIKNFNKNFNLIKL